MIPNLVGRQFDQYRLIEEIGRGGMGVVYRAWDERMEVPAAVKVLAPFLSWDPEFVERFRREGRTARQLKHPHIVTVYGMGEVEGLHYIAMEYVTGRSLLQMLHDEGRLAPWRCVGIVAQVADALDYAHAHGIVHRDVKPGNILVSPDLHATLTDFGLVYSAQLSRLSGPGFIGTPEYMAPEQADENTPVGPASDQYALGTVAFEMLTGRPPFQGPTPMGVLMARASRPPPPLRQFNGAVPAAVEVAVLRAIAMDPRDRYPTAGAFAQALAVAVGAPVEVKPSPLRRAPQVETSRGSSAPSESWSLDWLLIGTVVVAVAFVVSLIFLLNEGVDKPLNAATAGATSEALRTTQSRAANESTATAVGALLDRSQTREAVLRVTEARAASTAAHVGTATAAAQRTTATLVATPSPARRPLAASRTPPLPPDPRITLQAPGDGQPVKCVVQLSWLVGEPYASRSDVTYSLRICEAASDPACTAPKIAKQESGFWTVFDPGKKAEYEALGLTGANGTYIWFVEAVGSAQVPRPSDRRTFVWSGDGCGGDQGDKVEDDRSGADGGNGGVASPPAKPTVDAEQ